MSDNCSCISMFIRDEPYFAVKKIRTARKDHKCCECERIIKIAEKYEILKGKWDAKIETYKTCLDCLSLRKAFFCYGFPLEDLKTMVSEHISDSLGEISSDCIAQLTPTAREWVCEKIEECWERYYDDE